MTSINIHRLQGTNNNLPMCNLTVDMFITQTYNPTENPTSYIDSDFDSELNYDDMPPLQQIF